MSRHVNKKAVRLVREDRIRHTRDTTDTDGQPVRWFEVDGDTATYTVEWSVWGINCDCPARVRCSHQMAVRLWGEHRNLSHPGANVGNTKEMR